MTAKSQNGWTVDTSGAQQDRTGAAGVTFPNGVRRGDVATVLHYVAERFDAEVEPLRRGECWGWFVKGIEGSKSISNHASGTAIDLNAPAHPIGVRNTFSSAKRAKIRKIIADCDGVVRWGGDYSGRPDDMHFEIVGDAAEVAALARKIREAAEMTPAQLLDAICDALESPRGQAALKLAAGVGVHKQELFRSDIDFATAALNTTRAVDRIEKLLTPPPAEPEVPKP